MPKWTHVSKKAARAMHKRTHCADCGKYSGIPTTYEYPDGSSAGVLCDDCAKECWCLGCGYFMAGIESFDFSSVQGWCTDCLAEIDDDGDYDEWTFDDYDDDEDW